MSTFQLFLSEPHEATCEELQEKSTHWSNLLLAAPSNAWYTSSETSSNVLTERGTMPNQPSIYKRVLSIQIPRDLYHALQQEAAVHKLDLAVYVRMVLNEATLDVELTPESLAAIRDEVEEAKAKRIHHGKTVPKQKKKPS